MPAVLLLNTVQTMDLFVQLMLYDYRMTLSQVIGLNTKKIIKFLRTLQSDAAP